MRVIREIGYRKYNSVIQDFVVHPLYKIQVLVFVDSPKSLSLISPKSLLSAVLVNLARASLLLLLVERLLRTEVSLKMFFLL